MSRAMKIIQNETVIRVVTTCLIENSKIAPDDPERLARKIMAALRIVDEALTAPSASTKSRASRAKR